MQKPQKRARWRITGKSDKQPIEETEIRYDDPVLCYIDGNAAYFTTRQLDKQQGDDWNDAPYEHNAGGPYLFEAYRGCEPYQVIMIYYHTNHYEEPCAWVTNSQFSVDMINTNNLPWLYPAKYTPAANGLKPILAGTCLSEFKRLIWATGGEIFEVVEPHE